MSSHYAFVGSAHHAFIESAHHMRGPALPLGPVPCYFVGGDSGDAEHRVFKYDAAGELVWVREFDRDVIDLALIYGVGLYALTDPNYSDPDEARLFRLSLDDGSIVNSTAPQYENGSVLPSAHLASDKTFAYVMDSNYLARFAADLTVDGITYATGQRRSSDADNDLPTLMADGRGTLLASVELRNQYASWTPYDASALTASADRQAGPYTYLASNGEGYGNQVLAHDGAKGGIYCFHMNPPAPTTCSGGNLAVDGYTDYCTYPTTYVADRVGNSIHEHCIGCVQGSNFLYARSAVKAWIKAEPTLSTIWQKTPDDLFASCESDDVAFNIATDRANYLYLTGQKSTFVYFLGMVNEDFEEQWYVETPSDSSSDEYWKYPRFLITETPGMGRHAPGLFI